MAPRSEIEAYARLKALRQHLPEHDVDAKYVREFHQILQLLEQAAGIDLQSCRVPDSEIRPIPTGSSYTTGAVYYSDESYADAPFVLMKVDAVLTMFDLFQSIASSQGTSIGFVPRDA